MKSNTIYKSSTIALSLVVLSSLLYWGYRRFSPPGTVQPGVIEFKTKDTIFTQKGEAEMKMLYEKMQANDASIIVTGSAGGSGPKKLYYERFDAIVNHMDSAYKIDKNRFFIQMTYGRDSDKLDYDQLCISCTN